MPGMAGFPGGTGVLKTRGVHKLSRTQRNVRFAGKTEFVHPTGRRLYESEAAGWLRTEFMRPTGNSFGEDSKVTPTGPSEPISGPPAPHDRLCAPLASDDGLEAEEVEQIADRVEAITRRSGSASSLVVRSCRSGGVKAVVARR
jgi:hypothetical protein